MPVPAVARGRAVEMILLTTVSVAGFCSPVDGYATIIAARPSGLIRGGVTAATPGTARTAPASRFTAEPAAPGGSAAATISGASNPGPKPLAIVAYVA